MGVITIITVAPTPGAGGVCVPTTACGSAYIGGRGRDARPSRRPAQAPVPGGAPAAVESPPRPRCLRRLRRPGGWHLVVVRPFPRAPPRPHPAAATRPRRPPGLLPRRRRRADDHPPPPLPHQGRHAPRARALGDVGRPRPPPPRSHVRPPAPRRHARVLRPRPGRAARPVVPRAPGPRGEATPRRPRRSPPLRLRRAPPPRQGHHARDLPRRTRRHADRDKGRVRGQRPLREGAASARRRGGAPDADPDDSRLGRPPRPLTDPPAPFWRAVDALERGMCSPVRERRYTRSTIMAIPWPPPTHMVSRPTVLSASSRPLSNA